MNAWQPTKLHLFLTIVPITTLQDKIVSITPVDLEVAYLLTSQCKMRSIHHLWLWIIFYFQSDVCLAKKRAVNTVRHSERVSEERCNVSQLTVHTKSFTALQTLKDCALCLCSPKRTSWYISPQLNKASDISYMVMCQTGNVEK